MMGHYKHAQKLPTLADSKLELGQGNATFGSRSFQEYDSEVYVFYNKGWKSVPVKYLLLVLFVAAMWSLQEEVAINNG